MPVAGIFQQLKSMGYDGYVNLEYEINADDPVPGMKNSFAYMRGVIDGLSAKARCPLPASFSSSNQWATMAT